MRQGLSVVILIAGVALGLVSYFVLSASLGTPVDESYSNPTMPYAATLFVVSICLVFLSVIVYEVFPETERA